jgi:glucosylceramidase
MKYLALVPLFLVGLSCSQKTATAYLTRFDESAKFQETSFQASQTSETTAEIIDLNESATDQQADGFGFALTQGSAQALMLLSDTTRAALLQELFSTQTGLGISILRISIGASDLSNSVYTYADTENDTELAHFKAAAPDEEFLFPVLKEILAINPDVKIMATPWTAPIWMKDNRAWIGGKLLKEHYSTYSRYLLRFLDLMNSKGIPIWALSIQNEPENPHNEPSMVMTADEQYDFIQNFLGAALKEKYDTKILAYDHNCDHPEYPIRVLESEYTDGAAFHLYAGDISAMGLVRQKSRKDVYFTEQYTSTKGQFGGDLNWHLKHVVLGSLNQGSRSVIEWNLATDKEFGPRTAGGCTECLGALTIQNQKEFSRNVSYFILAHVSKVIQPGAVCLIAGDPSVMTVFRNPDQSTAAIILNETEEDKQFHFRLGKSNYPVEIPAKSVISVILSK